MGGVEREHKYKPAETADAEELENLDLSEGMDTGEADDGSLR